MEEGVLENRRTGLEGVRQMGLSTERNTQFASELTPRELCQVKKASRTTSGSSEEITVFESGSFKYYYSMLLE